MTRVTKHVVNFADCGQEGIAERFETNVPGGISRYVCIPALVHGNTQRRSKTRVITTAGDPQGKTRSRDRFELILSLGRVGIQQLGLF